MKVMELVRTKVSIVMGLLLLAVVFGLVRASDGGGRPLNSNNNVATPIASLSGDAILNLEVADSYFERIKGLSGRKSLPENTGLLFIFDEPGLQGIWMKDMLFSIDIIWLDEAYTIVGLKEGATPESYPEVFYPDIPASYVIEVPSGFVAEKGLNKDDTMQISF